MGFDLHIKITPELPRPNAEAENFMKFLNKTKQIAHMKGNHSNDAIQDMLMGTCNKVICLKCIVKVHNGHYFIDEEEFADKKRKLKDAKKKIQKNISKLTSEKETRNSREDTENHKQKHLKQNILEQTKKLHRVVDQYSDNLVQDVDRHCRILKHDEDSKIDKKIKKTHAKIRLWKGSSHPEILCSSSRTLIN
ncbi:unnamed protein product [Mytilus coruscus]|uniref:Uncharacterized protein n=1 Tax=Mytilus coruscus TaxID=42192 RepID=A0A6J8EQQ3_MYTCO|nr:unnamed protein product [Mytilus coruscus]